MAGARPKKENQAEKLLEKKRLLDEKRNGIKSNNIPPAEKPSIKNEKAAKDAVDTGQNVKRPPVDKTTVKNEPIIEKEIKEPASKGKDAIIDIDPLNESKTIQRDHSTFQPNIVGNVADVEELHLEAPVIDFNKQESIEEEQPIEEERHEQEPEHKGPERGEIRNPAMDDLSPKQKAASAEYLAEQAIIGYETLNNFGKDFVKFDEDKQQLKAIKGEFDFAVLDLRIPISETTNQTISVKEYLDTINGQADQIFVVTEEFKSKVRPLLIEIFKKHGWGLTPEQQLIAYALEDAGPKIAGIIAIKSSLNQLISISMQILENQNKPKTPPILTVEKEPEHNTDDNTEDIKKDKKDKKDKKSNVKKDDTVEPGEEIEETLKA
jgi:hypothetical protein